LQFHLIGVGPRFWINPDQAVDRFSVHEVGADESLNTALGRRALASAKVERETGFPPTWSSRTAWLSSPPTISRRLAAPENYPYSKAMNWLLVESRRMCLSAWCSPTKPSNSSQGTCFKTSWKTLF
jgi:hypothetical protein